MGLKQVSGSALPPPHSYDMKTFIPTVVSAPGFMIPCSWTDLDEFPVLLAPSLSDSQALWAGLPHLTLASLIVLTWVPGAPELL